MPRQAPAKLLNLIEPVVTGLGYELVGVEHLSQGHHSLLRIYIDNPNGGVTVDDCEKVSRQVSTVFDVEDPIAGRYSLEVSSPGLDRLLFKVQDFERFVGREIKVQLATPVAGRRKMTAKLLGIAEGVITVEFEGETMQFSFDDVEKARLVPEF
jgi:ribosome maturation factor RimP